MKMLPSLGGGGGGDGGGEVVVVGGGGGTWVWEELLYRVSGAL
jgi:hypothetical protein